MQLSASLFLLILTCTIVSSIKFYTEKPECVPSFLIESDCIDEIAPRKSAGWLQKAIIVYDLKTIVERKHSYDTIIDKYGDELTEKNACICPDRPCMYCELNRTSWECIDKELVNTDKEVKFVFYVSLHRYVYGYDGREERELYDRNDLQRCSNWIWEQQHLGFGIFRGIIYTKRKEK